MVTDSISVRRPRQHLLNCNWHNTRRGTSRVTQEETDWAFFLIAPEKKGAACFPGQKGLRTEHDVTDVLIVFLPELNFLVPPPALLMALTGAGADSRGALGHL